MARIAKHVGMLQTLHPWIALPPAIMRLRMVWMSEASGDKRQRAAKRRPLCCSGRPKAASMMLANVLETCLVHMLPYELEDDSEIVRFMFR